MRDAKEQLRMERVVFGTVERANAAAEGREEPLYEIANVFLRLPLHFLAGAAAQVIDRGFRVKTFLEFYNEYPHGRHEEYRKYHRIREQEAILELDDIFDRILKTKE